MLDDQWRITESHDSDEEDIVELSEVFDGDEDSEDLRTARHILFGTISPFSLPLVSDDSDVSYLSFHDNIDDYVLPIKEESDSSIYDSDNDESYVLYHYKHKRTKTRSKVDTKPPGNLPAFHIIEEQNSSQTHTVKHFDGDRLSLGDLPASEGKHCTPVKSPLYPLRSNSNEERGKDSRNTASKDFASETEESQQEAPAIISRLPENNKGDFSKSEGTVKLKDSVSTDTYIVEQPLLKQKRLVKQETQKQASDFQKAVDSSWETQSVLPLLKKELQYKIRLKRIKHGESEYISDEEKPNNYPVTFFTYVTIFSNTISAFKPPGH